MGVSTTQHVGMGGMLRGMFRGMFRSHVWGGGIHLHRNGSKPQKYVFSMAYRCRRSPRAKFRLKHAFVLGSSFGPAAGGMQNTRA